MNIFKKVIAVFLFAVLIFSLTACGEGNEEIVYFGLTEKEIPENLDPQTASSDSEIMIARNLYEGLLRKDESGKIVCGAAKEYKKSGKLYTFTLRKNLKWSDNSKLTADDFVYGFRRAVSKKTDSPFKSRLFCISGALEVYDGAGESKLAVSADGDKIYIRLKNDDPDFLETLTMPVCAPCSEKFFKDTEGKYGKDAKNILSNGSYTLTKWNKEDFGIRLYKSNCYNGKFAAKNGGVFFSVPSKEKPMTQTERLNKNACDLAFLPCVELNNAKKSDFKVASVQNICWVLTISNEYPLSVRTALLEAITPSLYESDLPDGFSAAYSFYPEILSVKSADGVGILPYNIESAKARFSAAVATMPDKAFPAPTLYYYGDLGIKDTITKAVANWQENLCAFVNISPVSSLDSITSELKTKTLQMALFPVFAKNGSLSEYLQNFGVSGDADFAQSSLMEDKTIVPFAFQNTNIAYTGSLSGVLLDSGNGFIDFAFVKKDG